ncbi:alpha/beta hydrolase [uncultured Flavobacterium sp.]|uniref:alpha/beta hydrolase n=1 Tax=uncultured Flavobacterium sp. TaxID=165435 RepID=UPI0025DB1A11|nr:alpha/beta hydrolase [uncultured Flavobacterium sp.]
MNPITNNTIIFITGAFISHHIWKPWIEWFESKGYTCMAPAWPHKDGTARELRKRLPNDTGLAGTRLQDVIDHHINIIGKLPAKPIVIGHSLGGLIAQLLVNRDLVAAGVAIHTVPAYGSLSLEWSSVKSIWKPLGFLSSSKKTYLMDEKEWNYAIANGMNDREQKSSYDQYAIPASKLVLRDALTKDSKIDFKKVHPPILFISGTGDHMTPEPVVYNNFAKYDPLHSVTDYKEFKNRNHFVLALPTWQEEADYIYEWLQVVNK